MVNRIGKTKAAVIKKEAVPKKTRQGQGQGGQSKPNHQRKKLRGQGKG